MTTKDPFVFPGFSMSIKKGERGLFETAFRYAEVIKNKDGEDKFGYKLNFFRLLANDWNATNYEPIFGSPHGAENPYGYDAVNIYGDEPIAVNNDNTDAVSQYAGLGVWYRKGYREKDLVNYDTDNMKFNSGLYYKITPEVVANYNLSYSTGSTIYQGDNRYALRDVEFFQHKVEIKDEDHWFIRAYTTSEDAGNTYDIVTTAVRMLDASGTTADWNTRFASLWSQNVADVVKAQPRWDEIQQQAINSGLTGEEQFAYWQGLLMDWYLEDYDYFNGLYEQNAAATNALNSSNLDPFYQPGTERFDSLFNDVTNRLFTQNGSRFYDRSKLYHVHGEYKKDYNGWEIVTGANMRWYRPDSRGTIFKDTLQYTYLLDDQGNYVLNPDGSRAVSDSIRLMITNREWGAYAGVQRMFMEDKLKMNATARVDKNENFDYLVSPALSLVYTTPKNHTARMTFSSAIRNPTLADQYLYYNVGRATLLGNIDGRFEEGQDSLFTIESFNDYRNSTSLLTGLDELEYFNVEKIRPEKVKTIELGYRGTWFENTYIDAVVYYSNYTDFIGYNIGFNGEFNQTNGFPVGGLQVFRVAANAKEQVITTGLSVGFNYYFKRLSLNGNYSFNKLISDNDDPIIPAYNTPENKYNLGLSGRDLQFLGFDHFGFSVNYKWIQGFLFE
ncbi:MAG: TonB-dependent receptor, partial [Flavobacteriales bacterium]|nr:TonB-dependent receptor [Flavobacteriales bacterium]